MYIHLTEPYTIRIDKNCAYLIQISHVINKNKDIFDSFCIPVFMGYILAHVGDFKFEHSLRVISKKFNIPEIAIRNFINQLVDNPEGKKFKIDNSCTITLPPNLLCKSERYHPVNFWECSEFDIRSDFSIRRPQMPFSINIMVTTQCTTDCVYCYANRSLKPVMKVDKILNLIEELHSVGVVNITLTGGDVFARSDWEWILRKLKECDYFPYISTKTPINYDEIAILRDLGYEEIQFSLDSCSESILNTMVKSPVGYFQKVIEFLNNSDKLGMNVLIRSVLTSLNSDIITLKEFYKFLSGFDSVKEWAITPAFFSSFKSDQYKKLEVSKENLKKVYMLSKQEGLKFPIKLNKISQHGYELKTTATVEDFVRYNQICLANTTSMSILANGKCTICEMLYEDEAFLLGDVNKNSVKEIWNSSKALDLYALKQQTVEVESPCSVCEEFSKCKNGYGKRVCYLDIRKSGKSLSYPDPRCPMADDYDLIF